MGGIGIAHISTEPSGLDDGRASEEDAYFDVSSKAIHAINIKSIFKYKSSIFSQSIANVFSIFLLLFVLFASISGASAALSVNPIVPTSVNICDSNGFVVYINNTGTTSENDILLNVTLPSVFFSYDGNSNITFPGGSSNADPPTLGQYLEWNLTEIMTTETGVVINEILPNPTEDPDGANERVELYNAGTTTVNVSGWYINDTANNSRDIESHIESGSVNMTPGSFLVISIINLNNGGDEVILYDDLGNQIDKVTYHDSSSQVGKSWACMPDGSEYWNWKTSTLGATNGDLASGSSIRVGFNLTTVCGTPSGGRIRADVFYLGGSAYKYSPSMLVKQGFLKVTKTPNVVEAGVGDVVNWTITVENTGLGPAYNVRVNDSLSSGLNLLAIDSPNSSMNWTYDVIGPGEKKTVNISVNVTACVDLYDRVNVSWGCNGSPCQNTYTKASVKLIPRDPDLTYTVSPMVVPYCGNVTVYVNVSNSGLGGITNLQLNFTGISADYAVSNVSGATYYPGNKTFYLGRVPSNSWKNFTFDFGMAYGACAVKGAAGTITIYPNHEDDCGNPWRPPVSLESYSMDLATIPSLSVSKTASKTVAYLDEMVNYTLNVTYTAGSCSENTTRTIVDHYPENFTLIDSAGGANDFLNHTITWTDQLLEDGEIWSRTIRLKAAAETAACDCGKSVTNQLNVSEGVDCCGCSISGGSSAEVIIECINETALISSAKSVSPDSQENCRNVTYSTVYSFTDNVGSLNWTDINFTELGGNGQTFPDGGNSGEATFTVNGTCSSSQTMTIGIPINLGFLNNAPCGPLGDGAVLNISYTFLEPDTWSGSDWSVLCIEGYGSGCSGDSCLYESTPVTVSRADYSIGISGVPTKLDSCEVFNVTIALAKGSPDDDPRWIGHEMYITYDDTNYRYIGPATISNIANYVNQSHSEPVASFEPTRSGNDLVWHLGANISRAGTITFPVEKRCPPGSSMTADLNYTDNCGELQTGSAPASPSLVLDGNLIIQKNPEVIFAIDRNASWKIYVTNSGSGTAYNVTVNDTLETDLSYVSSGIDGASDPSNTTVIDSNHIVWNLGNLSPKQQRVIELNATLVGCYNRNNSVQAVWGCGGGECKTPVSDSSIVELVNGSLLIARHDADPIDDCGGNSTFVIEVKNGADPTLYNVSITENLPAGLEYVAGSSQVAGASTTSTDFSGNPLEWRFDQPEGWVSGTSVTITFNVTVTSDPCVFTSGNSVVGVNYTTPCGDYGAVIESVLALGETDPHVSISKTPELTVAEAGTIVTWTIQLDSDGTDPAKNVTLFDVLPINTAYDSATPSPNSTAPLRWDFGTMNVGDSRTITLKANVSYCDEERENNATVFWGCCPDDFGMESDVAFLRTPPIIDLSKDHGDIDTCGGNFTITINNTGSTAYTPEVKEILPVGFVYKTGSAVISSDNASHDATITNYVPAFDHSLTNGTVIWDGTNFDRVYHNETITISFEMESCPSCCNVSVSPNTNLVYFNYTNRCGDPLSENFSQPITPKLAVLDVEKTPFNQTVGGEASWTITLTNDGNGTARNVTVRDVIGDGFFDVAVAEPDGNVTESGYTTVEWSNLTLDVSESWVRHITAKPTGSGSLVNNVYAFGTCENGCIYSSDEDAAYTARINITKDPDAVETIGGFANFTIQVEYWGASEQYNNTRIEDNLPAGLKYHDYECVEDTGGVCGTANVSGNPIVWDLGNFSGDRLVRINLSTIVEDVFGNQNGTSLVNRVESFHEDENGTVFDDGDEANVTIVEPDLAIEKSSSASSGVVVAGDEIRYSINVSHTGLSRSDAYDLVINDTIPEGLVFVAGSNTSTLSTVFSRTGQNLTWTLSSLSLAGTNYVFLTYNVTVGASVVLNTTLTNNAIATWTSTSGPNDDERFGNWTYLDDYNREDNVTLMVNSSTTVIKLPDDLRTRTIGESVNYTIRVDLPNATALDLWVNDTLPEGLIYNSTSLSIKDNNGVALTPTGSPSDPNNGTSKVFINWSFGNFDNSANRDIVIEFDAIVANVDGNQAGDTIGNNSASYSWLDNSSIVHTGSDDSGKVEIEEPVLDINKTFSPAGPFSVGDTIAFSINVTNFAPSQRTAYDLVINDTLPSGLTYVNLSAPGIYSPGNRTLIWTFPNLDLDSWLVVTYNVTVNLDVVGNSTLVNTAFVTWTSTSGPNPNERTGNGTGPNNYSATDSAPVDVQNSTTVIKLPDELRYRTIGESVNYTIRVDLPNATVQDLWVNDTLPQGLIYNSTSLLIKDNNDQPISLSSSENISDPNDGTATVYINWSFGNFDNSANRDIVIQFDAIVANVDGNQAGTTIENNSASYSWLDNSSFLHTGSDDSGKVKVEEPLLDINKTFSPAGPFSVGDSIQFSINVTNFDPSQISAYDLVINDTIPSGLTYVNLSSPGIYSPGNRTLIWTFPNLDLDSWLVVTYNVTVNLDVVGNSTLVNSAFVTWTSTSGPNPNERTGNGTGPNNYSATDSAPVDVQNSTTVIKLPDELRYRTIGESVNYTIRVDLPNATALDLWVNDTLPIGLIFNSTTSISAPAGSASPATTPSSPNDGTAVVYVNWSFGQVNNSENDDIKIEFDAIVADVEVNRKDVKIANNSAQVQWKDSNDQTHTETDDSGKVQIQEPDLDIAKFVSPSGEVVVGQNLNFSIKVVHTADSNSTAYDLVINDTIPDGFSFVSGTQTSVPGATTSTQTGQNISWTYNRLNLSTTAWLNYSVTVDSGEISNLTLVNKAEVTWTSTSGPNENERYGNWTELDDYNDTIEVPVDIEPASIGDRVWLDTNGDGVQDLGETGVDNVTVNLYNSTGSIINTTSTNATGYYDFINLVPGNYSVGFVLPSGYSFSPQDQGADDAVDSDANTSTGRTVDTTLDSDETDPTWDAGIYNLASIGDRVWLDTNSNGIQDPGETGVDNVTVNLYNSTGSQINSTLTNLTGYYNFTKLVPGNYSVGFVLPSGYVFSPQNQGADDAVDSDANTSTGRTVDTTLDSDETDPTWDAGIYQPASISIDKTSDVYSGSVSTRVNFTMVVTNTGNATLDLVVVNDTLPFGLDNPAASFGGSVSGNEVTWNLGKMNSSDSTTVWLTAHINGSKFGNLTNIARVEGKPEYGDNVTDSDTENVTVVDASIRIGKTSNISSGSVSTRVNFTIVVTNTGNATLDPVIVNDTLPFGLDNPAASFGGSVSGNEVTWNLGKMNSSDSTTVWLTAHINGSKFDNLTNVARVEGKPEHGDNVTDSDSVNVTSLFAQITVWKRVDIPAGEVCTNVTFTIFVNNTGRAVLDPVVLTDTLPFGLEYVSSAPPGNRSGNTVTWNLSRMDPGSMKIVELVAHINGSKFGNLTNLVDVEGKPEHGDNVTYSNTENVTALGADIDVEKSVDIPVGSASTRVNFTILVNNTGNVALDPVRVTDTLPFGLDDPVPSDGGSVSGNVVTWNPGRLNVNDTRTLWLEAHINSSAFGELKNLVEVEGDPEFGDNVTDNDSVNVTALGAKIDVEKSVDIPMGSASTRVNFTIVVNNSGNADLDPVMVTDTIPYGLDDPVPSDGGSVSGNVVTWNLGRLNKSDSATLHLEAHINGSKFDNLTNFVEVEGKPDHGDNVTGDDSVNVTALGAKIEVNKTVDIDKGEKGTNVTFTILVKNSGSADLDPVIVTDTLPPGLNYVNSTPPGVKLGDVVTWNLSRLNKSDSRSIELVAQINISEHQVMTNLVEVEGKPDHGDNVTESDYENVTAFRSGLEVNKTANFTGTELFKEVNYTIIVTNTGNIRLAPVNVTDTLPAGIDYVSAHPAPESVTPPAPQPGVPQVVVWSLAGLDPGESATIFLTGFVNSGALNGTRENEVKVLGFVGGKLVNETEDNETIEIYRLEVNKTASKNAVKRGEEVTYTISVCNTGTVPLTNVVVRDAFDKAVEFVSVSYSWSGGFKPHIEMIGEGEWLIDFLPNGSCVDIILTVKVPKQDFEFNMDQGVRGEGFVNVAGDYSTTLSEYVIRNNVKASTVETGDQDYETVTVLGEPGTELSTREHGSGGYESEEQVKMFTENKSISMDKDVSAEYRPTTLGLYNNRTVNYSSRWTEEARAKNRITGASMSESYRYATRIDRESSMQIDKKGSTMEIDSEFEGMGHVGFLKKANPEDSAQGVPTFEAREDYVGSFKVLEKVDEYGSSVSSDKSVSGAGLVAVDKWIGESQRSYESGTGTYDSDELIRTHTNYIAKDISLEYAPASMNLTGTNGTWINQSMLWKEGMRSRSRGISYIGEEYTSISQLDKETVALGLNEMDTVANFSGRARYRTVLKDEVDIDEQYEGDYSIERRVLLTGVPKYDRPHMTVVKNGSIHEETILDAKETTLVGESKDEVIKVATYTITIENDGNKALGPIYVRDLFPPKAAYINSSVRPSELADTYANWTLTHLAIGDVSTIVLNLDVTKHHPDELVNRVIVTAGYNGDEWITASNFTALEMEWLACCPNETVSVTKTSELDEENPNVVMYSVEIKNWADATRVATVTDSLPAGMVLLDSMVPFASYENDTITWNLVEIGPFETVTIAYRVEAQRAGRFVNSVEVDPRSVDGPVVQPVYASSVIDVGVVEECGTTSCTGWNPPNWEFEHVGYSAELSCEDMACE